MATKPPLTVFRPLKLQVLANRLGLVKGQPFEFGLGNRIVQELGSSRKGSKNLTTKTSTLRFVEEEAKEVCKLIKQLNCFEPWLL